MKKSTIFSLFVFFVLIPATLILGTKLPGRVFYLISTLVIAEIMLPLFVSMEMRKPDARELCMNVRKQLWRWNYWMGGRVWKP